MEGPGPLLKRPTKKSLVYWRYTVTNHKVTISQQLPDGEILETEVIVSASTGDSALGMVYKWYDKVTHVLHERDEVDYG